MTQELSVVKKVDGVKEYLSVRKNAWVKILHNSDEANEQMGLFLSVLTQNPALLECTPESQLRSFILGVQLGLVFGTKEIYLVPFNNSKSGNKDCTPIIGYQGKIKLMSQHANVSHIQAYAVFEGDVFDYNYGTSPRIDHKPMFASPETKENLLYVYAVAFLSNGRVQFEVLDKAKIEIHRNRSKAKDKEFWTNYYIEMAMKAAVHDLEKWVPKSRKAQMAERAEERIAAGEQYIDLPPEAVRDVTKKDEIKRSLEKGEPADPEKEKAALVQKIVSYKAKGADAYGGTLDELGITGKLSDLTSNKLLDVLTAFQDKFDGLNLEG